MKTDELLTASELMIQWNDMHVVGLQVSSDRRARLAAACLDMVHEHHRAIILLCKNRIYGSAFALVRPLFESFVRGVWLHRCATERDIRQYCAETMNYSFDQLVKQVETLPELRDSSLSVIKSGTWKGMNSYTHSGYRQAMSRNTSSSITPNYEDGAIQTTLRLSLSFSVVATMAIAKLVDHPWLAQAAVDKQEELLQALTRRCS